MTLTDVLVQQIIQTIAAELKRRNKQASIAVVDAHGELHGFLRLDKTKLTTIANALNKAYTSARTQRLSSEVGRNVKHPETGFDIAYYGDPRIVGFGGGVPIKIDGQVVGAVAVSGLLEEEDEELALFGIASLDA